MKCPRRRLHSRIEEGGGGALGQGGVGGHVDGSVGGSVCVFATGSRWE